MSSEEENNQFDSDLERSLNELDEEFEDDVEDSENNE